MTEQKSSTDDEEEGDTDLPAGNDQDITLTISNKDQEETVDQKPADRRLRSDPSTCPITNIPV